MPRTVHTTAIKLVHSVRDLDPDEVRDLDDDEPPCPDCRDAGVFPGDGGEWASCVCPAGYDRACAGVDAIEPTDMSALTEMFGRMVAS